MNEQEIDKAEDFCDRDLYDELYDFLKPFIKISDPYAFFLASSFSLPEWEESTEEFDRRHIEYLRKAASADIAPAIYRLSSYYLIGELVEVDISVGQDYLQRAIDLGYGPARTTLALNLCYGANGYKKDIEMALNLAMEAEKDGVEGASSIREQIESMV